MTWSDYLPSSSWIGSHAWGVAQEGAYTAVFGRKWKHRVIDAVLLAAAPLAVPAISGMFMAVPHMMERRARTAELVKEGLKELRSALLDKLKNDFQLHLDLQISDLDEAQRHKVEKAARAFLRTFENVIVEQLSQATTEREALLAWNLALKCLEDKVACAKLPEEAAINIRTAYAALDPSIQKITRTSIKHVRNDYRSLLRYAAAVSALLTTLALVYHLAPEDWNSKSPGEVLAAAAVANGASPPEVQAAADKLKKQIGDLEQEIKNQEEKAREAEAALKAKIQAAERKHQDAVASQLAGTQQAQLDTLELGQKMQKQINRLAEAQNGQNPMSSAATASALQAFMPTSILSAVSVMFALSAVGSATFLIWKTKKLTGNYKRLEEVASKSQKSDEIITARKTLSKATTRPFLLKFVDIFRAKLREKNQSNFDTLSKDIEERARPTSRSSTKEARSRSSSASSTNSEGIEFKNLDPKTIADMNEKQRQKLDKWMIRHGE